MEPSPPSPVPPLLVLHLVILAWAFTAILGKLISLPSLDMVVWRTALATAGFSVIALVMGTSLRLARRDAASLFGLGAILGIHWVLFFLSARLATASVSLAAMPTMLIWSSLIEPLVNGTRRWNRVELLLGLVIIGAVWMIYAVELKHWFGFTVGILSALVASVYAVFNKQVVALHPFASLCAWQLGGACAASWLLLPFVSGTFLPAVPGARDLGWLVLFAFGCTVLPYAAFVYVMRHLSVFTVNVVYNLEPLYGMALAALVFGSREQMTPGFYAGAGIIIASVLAVPWLQGKGRPA
ncbi:MAG: DMT family transporter [Verrucomicrobiae bacterium]|nr:DMT family transporter [Verrucomicrobiae bacterium]